jgi:ribosomal protein S18 acetylase RimI-like enzyme
VSVRAVRSDELDRLKEIRLRALADAPGAFGSRYDEEVPRDPELWRTWITRGGTFIVEDDRGWHGLVAVFLDENDASLCHLVSMWVAPDHRGRGLGRDLLVAGVDWARAMGAASVRLGVVDGNAIAARLYEQAGFCATGESEPLRSDPMKSIVFMALERAENAGRRGQA